MSNILLITIFGVVGSIMNRIRGGWLKERLKGITVRNKVYNYNKILNDLVFGLMITLMDLRDTMDITQFNFETFFLAASSMAIGRSLGWGVYIGRLGGWLKDKWDEVEFIDDIIKPLQKWPKLWGWAGLSLRGGFWGYVLSLNLGDFTPMLFGLTMGTVYFLTIEFSRLVFKDPARGWPIGEWVFGPVIWIGALLTKL